jgi:hypothetical protein
MMNVALETGITKRVTAWRHVFLPYSVSTDTKDRRQDIFRETVRSCSCASIVVIVSCQRYNKKICERSAFETVCCQLFGQT